ncbi:biotin transporter BioY [Luteipulveratus sp. YIM 133132]|uniref:Biotin transporter n=1 Tax=Luteipulveratus flavus TaxID=3031728 RepID=A0ABT6C294_9MICO|nr:MULTISPECIES: biotin transporter BioY [unclassified Luteipulveratus]MDE9367054.1 biotin transporter BioY [Luteipulveratus sp. YIM 133132]MDF8263039.1 biotin transporter BioY [Luteipulveratus sp. YIM 133296]
MSRTTPRDLALVAMFAALVAVLGMPGGISFFGSVPITAQTLGFMLAGAILGARLGALSVIVFDLLLAAGLPIGAGGHGGLAVLTGPTGGYLIGAIPGVFLTGLLVQRFGRRNAVAVALACVVGCMGVVYLVGIPWSAWRLDSGLLGVAQSAVQFLPGDLAKCVIAALVTTTVVRAYPPIETIGTDRDATADREHERVDAA